VNRRRVHTRSITVEAWRRDDECWDLVAHIRDTKDRPLPLEARTLEPGEPLHDMELTVTIDGAMNVVAAGATTRAAPYPDACLGFGDVYGELVGLNLLKGFRAGVRERVGARDGCTHVTELAAVLPTVAIQAFANEVSRPDRATGTMPRHLDGCRALRRDGAVVARLYPQWRQQAEDPAGASHSIESKHGG
jgi:hypothetical protein